MRTIDADALKKDLTRFYDNEITAKQLIDEQPTIEPKTDVLDDIRAEIRKKMRFDSFNEAIVSYDDISKIFDKYEAESEEV